MLILDYNMSLGDDDDDDDDIIIIIIIMNHAF